MLPLRVPLNSIDDCLIVCLHTYPLTDCKCISHFTCFQPPSSHDYGLKLYIQTHSIIAYICIFNLHQILPPSLFLRSLDYGIQFLTITVSMYISMPTKILSVGAFQLHLITVFSLINHIYVNIYPL